MKTKSPAEKLKDERAAIAAKSIATCDEAKAAGRDLTPAEAKSVEDGIERMKAIDTQLKTYEESRDLIAKLNGLGGSEASYSRGAGLMWAKSVTDGLAERAGQVGVKALLSGEVTTPPTVDVVPLPDIPARLLDLIPREALDQHSFSYLRQTVRNSAAETVADGATKPTSTYTFIEVEDHARVIAHLSEPFPIRFASDHASMIDVLNTQLVMGVWEEIERLVINGGFPSIGTEDEWLGLLGLAGSLTSVPYIGDMVSTLRRARTVLESKGEKVTAVAMHPQDAEALDMTREDGDTGGFLLDTDAYARIFGPGVHGVTSLAVPQGVAFVGDWSTLRLRIRQNAHTLAATQAGDLFEKNQVKLRTEGRFGLEVRRPQAMALVLLSDAGESGSA